MVATGCTTPTHRSEAMCKARSNHPVLPHVPGNTLIGRGVARIFEKGVLKRGGIRAQSARLTAA